MIKEIDVHTLNNKFLAKEEFILLDVRTDSEYYLSNIPGATHIPMIDIPSKINDLDKKKEIIVQCKSGKRSAKVCKFLSDNDFYNVKNLKGGILAWAKYIDQSVIVC